MGRAPCCDKDNVKRGPWSPEEDSKLKSYIENHGTGGNWIALPQKIGLKRCGKSCRLRWLNYLRPNIKHGGFTEDEDNLICTLYINIGSRWSIIAAQLPGRTDNDIKNYWNTKLKKKLLGKQKREQQARRDCYLHEQIQSRTNDIFSLYPPQVSYANQETRVHDQQPIMPPLGYVDHTINDFDAINNIDTTSNNYKAFEEVQDEIIMYSMPQQLDEILVNGSTNITSLVYPSAALPNYEVVKTTLDWTCFDEPMLL
ncbi:hypothetical protein ACJIZ3_014980 [Penstemon smallii]|uniref:Uncharacterized protein n=1 Tax=Penstemon smallii TaxID=265156 RepID=A0ABD3RNH0_9LAMI